jgi:hypothetical protein
MADFCGAQEGDGARGRSDDSEEFRGLGGFQPSLLTHANPPSPARPVSNLSIRFRASASNSLRIPTGMDGV